MQKFGNAKVAFCHVFTIIFILASFAPSVPAAEIVVNKAVPEAEYSEMDIRAIFTMQKRFWPNNKQIKVYTLPDNHPLHKDFVKNSLHMFPHQVRRIWDRMIFSGTGVAPVELDNEQQMLEKIANTPGSIGYLGGNPDDKNIRVLEYH